MARDRTLQPFEQNMVKQSNKMSLNCVPGPCSVALNTLTITESFKYIFVRFYYTFRFGVAILYKVIFEIIYLLFSLLCESLTG